MHAVFLAAFNAGDIDTLLNLYEDDAGFVTGDGNLISGHAALRATFEFFLGMKPKMEMETVSVREAAGLALLSGRWVLTGTDSDGSAIRMTGTTQEVARRGADRAWRYVIDDPGIGR